jgi:3-hydroxybutyryl-CoA dehydrogenase
MEVNPRIDSLRMMVWNMTIQATNPIGIVGAETLGIGIAQAVASAGWVVLLFDGEPSKLELAESTISKRFQRLVQMERISESQASDFLKQIVTTRDFDNLSQCDLIIDAVTDEFKCKSDTLTNIGKCSSCAVIATSTSLLSVNDLGEACGFGDRVVGMHFFSSSPNAPLVEIISGKNTTESASQRATLIAEACGKTVVHCSDTPGFIVNRISLPYYLEPWRIVEEGIATIDIVDEAMQTLGEFKMGPFILGDLVGQDVISNINLSVWERLGKPNRLAPSDKQASLISKGHLGKKTSCGAYAHDDKKIVPALIHETLEFEISNQLEQAINVFCLEATCTSRSILEKYIFSRVLVSIINEAMWSSSENIASKKDIDDAMKLATNYPLGPFEWADKIGMDRVLILLNLLNKTVADNRFASPPLDTVPSR